MADPRDAPRNVNSGGEHVQLNFDTDFAPQAGKHDELGGGIARIVAPNAGPYTFTGTNTYLIGRERVFIVDPGPNESKHLDAILSAVSNRPVEAILLTHTHRDHSALALRLRDCVDAPLWFGGKHRLSRPLHLFEFNPLNGSCDWDLAPDRMLRDGEELSVDDMAVRVIATPGHCANHLSFAVNGEDCLLSGDHVMGWNSTLVATPDGDMTAYLASLDRIISADWTRYLPGHGGPVRNGPAYAAALKRHREMRNSQILKCVSDGAVRIPQIVAQLYPGVPPATRRAAALTVRAHVEHLGRHGQLQVKWRWGRVHVRPA